MKYMGSKNIIAKQILPIILKNKTPERVYIEPFVGGGNIIDKVEGFRIGADINPYTIEALKLIRDNPESLPFELTKEQYAAVKEKKEINGFTGWVSFSCSFGGKFFNGFAQGGGRNHVMEARNNAIKQSPFLKNCIFINCNYWELDIPKNAIVYCDPPYANTTKYKDGFDSYNFWEWVRLKSSEGIEIYVSEYTAPEDFIPIWGIEINCSLAAGKPKKTTEKLFIYNDLY